MIPRLTLTMTWRKTRGYEKDDRVRERQEGTRKTRGYEKDKRERGEKYKREGERRRTERVGEKHKREGERKTRE